MGKVSIDLSSLKAAGIYTLEVDNSQRTNDSVESLRMLVGFSNKGPFNRPVLLEQDSDRLSIFGDVDTKLEHKGCFFNRMLRTLLTGGPVIALNLLKVDNSYNGPDQVNYATLSIDAATANPVVENKRAKYGEYDYLADTIDQQLYDTSKGDVIPYVGTTPFASVYNRSRFWTPDKDLLTAAAARGLKTPDYAADRGTYEYTNFLNFANVGTEEFSLLVFKPANMNGYDVTAESWYGGKENIPFGWIRPYDFISDYFLQVVCVKGNWTNYPVLSTDPVWGSYFEKSGIIKNKVNSFMGAEGITILGSWTGIIIPDFTDKQGNNLSLEKKVNAATERTGLLMSFNNDVANVLTYDYSGFQNEEADADSGCWGIDIDGNSEIEEGESVAQYIVDMVGHGAFMDKSEEIKWIDASMAPVLKANDKIKVNGARQKTYTVSASVKTPVACIAPDFDASFGLNDSDTCYAGAYIDASVFVQDMPENLEFTDENLVRLFVNKYVVVAQSGAISYPALNAASMKFDYDYDKVVAGDKIQAYITIEDSLVEVDFTVDLEADNEEGVDYITGVTLHDVKVEVKQSATATVKGINFLSYNYISSTDDGVLTEVGNSYYFSDEDLWEGATPVDKDTKNLFIVDDSDSWLDEYIKVGDYVKNIAYENENGVANEYKLIPGLTRVIKKQFYKVQVDNETGKNYVMYKGQKYFYKGHAEYAKNRNYGFYLITCSAPVLIANKKVERQLPISDEAISHTLRFIPMKGLSLSSRHRPGYDENGNLDMESGIQKIYSVLEDEGIQRGLMNPSMVNFRYLIDSMSYGLSNEMGGKVYISRTASERGKCTAILNLPSAKQFAVSSNPYFCDAYTPGADARPAMNTKYIAAGGNTEMGAEAVFSLPTEDDGAKFTACFWPNLIYTENGKTISIPPAADVANVLNRKFTGVSDPYCICANRNGILSNRYLTGLEFLADRTDREYLEPFGVNTIIKDGSDIMIYGNQTAFQAIKSDLNKLHVRENLNTAEIECEAVLKKYNFLYNTAATRANIVAQLTPILQVMLTSGALAQYEIICDESNNTAEVIEADTCCVDINLWFNHGMEKIVQTFTINRYASLND